MPGFPQRFPLEGGDGSWAGQDAQVSQQSDYSLRARKQSLGYFATYGASNLAVTTTPQTIPFTVCDPSLQVNFYSPGVVEILNSGLWQIQFELIASGASAAGVRCEGRVLLTRAGTQTTVATTSSSGASTDAVLGLSFCRPFKLLRGDLLSLQTVTAPAASTATLLLSSSLSSFSGFQLTQT